MCSDCISRQAAIEALDRIGSVDTEADREYARDVFDNLPPVTPTVKVQQADTLIIADALRCYSQDRERNISNRERAEELREQVLAYGASMCKPVTPTDKDKRIKELEDLFADMLESAQPVPSVTPTDRTVEWMVEEKDSIYGKKIRLTCSECGDVFDVTESAYPYERYCRYCGAKMKGGAE